MLKNLPIRLKMVALYLNMTVFTIPILLFSYFQMQGMSARAAEWSQQVDRLVSAAGQAVSSSGSQAALAALQSAAIALQPSAYAAEIADKANAFARIYPLFILVYLGVTVFIGRKLAKVLAFPIQALNQTADHIAMGDIDVNLDYDAKDEIGSLYGTMRRVVNGFRAQSQILDRIAQGDYTGSIDLRSDRDVVNQSISTILNNNNSVMSDIQDAAQQVSGVANQIANGAQSLASGSAEQAATIQQFSAAITQVQAQAEENNRVAQKTYEETMQAGEMMAGSMEYMQQLSNAILTISETSQNISKVIKVIDDIAFQTNILALNAAVEAARAGQHGKGFAVVAEEVRSLASKSAKAAKETAELIESSVTSVAQGSDIAKRTAESLLAVAQIASDNAVAMSGLSESSRQQNAAISEINLGVVQISSVVQANSATAQQSAASAQEMSAQSATLADIVSHFKLRNQAALGSAPVFALPKSTPRLNLEGDLVFDDFRKY